MKRFSAVLQFILGVFIGIALLLGGAAAVGYVLFSRMASPPDKPIFAEEKEEPVAKVEIEKKPAPAKSEAKAEDKAAADKEVAKSPDAAKSEPKTLPTAQPKPESPPETTAKQEEKAEESKSELPSGAYKAKVTWSSGLSLRLEPSTSSERVGGVEYNSELIVLSTSSDGQWQRVRLANGTQEGWIKAGNIKKSTD
jgi:type IV secretory pathway VirB10-like protein